ADRPAGDAPRRGAAAPGAGGRDRRPAAVADGAVLLHRQRRPGPPPVAVPVRSGLPGDGGLRAAAGAVTEDGCGGPVLRSSWALRAGRPSFPFFQESSPMSDHATRRQFLGAAGAAALTAATYRRVLGAEDRVAVGFIGTGGRGRSLIRAFRK